MRSLTLTSTILVALVASACSDREVTIVFAPLVGDQEATCGGTYEGIGTTDSSLTLNDFRFYLYDLALVADDGTAVPVILDEVPGFQAGSVALVDFETGGADCPMGTTERHSAITGVVEEDRDFTGIRFTLGVPSDLNHQDVSTAAAPLNIPGMFWSWNAGYKFLRVDASSTGLDGGFFIHLGSTGCEGDGRGNVTGCVQENRVTVELSDFDPENDQVAVDLAALLAETDIDNNATEPALCMSGFDDTDCESIFHGLGLDFQGAAGGAQRLFRVTR